MTAWASAPVPGIDPRRRCGAWLDPGGRRGRRREITT